MKPPPLRGPLARVVPGHARCVMLRAATRRDVGRVVELGAAADRTEHGLLPDIAARRSDARAARRYWRHAIGSRRTRLFVAASGSTVLAAIAVDLIVARHRLAPVRRRVYLHSLFVTPRARGRGLARRLTKLALDWGRGRGATQARLEMAAPNRAARRLYESVGFRAREVMLARRL